ncbi:MAG: shikimate kinase [Cardiobacteriaceae bacterium]|nr:shikimate kinase [Cardiobacteriaceae bacterium]
MTVGRKIVLIGPMGAGKTSLGRRLATRLRWEFIDTDHALCARTGVDIPTIFAAEGEAGFRKRENEVLTDILSDSREMVVACGGGIVIKAENRRIISSQFLVVFLDVSVRRQILRIGRDRNRPLVQNTDNLQLKLEQLRDERLGLYEGLADIRVDTDNNHFTHSFKRLLSDVESRLKREKS